MSHSVLRSVSPIHLEYLINIGVASSMSISIIVNGQLWGMVACHHGAAHQVPYAVRMACDVLAQIVAAHVQKLAAREQVLHAAKAVSLRAQLLEVALQTDGSSQALASISPQLVEAFGADAVLVGENGKLHIHGSLTTQDAERLIEWLAARDLPLHEVIAVASALGMPGGLEGAQDDVSPWCGLLATRYDEQAAGWLVLLRREQVTSIVWGREPHKGFPSGPLGARLTPQGSTAAWQETVCGTSIPWSAAQLELASQVVDELARAGSIRMTELNRARAQLLAMLGHDLRDPLQAIAMAAMVLEQGGAPAETGVRMGRRIQSSSRRMERLIGLVLDASMLQNGFALRLELDRLDLSALMENMVDEARTAHPGAQIVTEIGLEVFARADADRLQQLVGNLISNARQHCTPGEPVIVQLTTEGDMACIQVSNIAPPLKPQLLRNLYSAFHHVAAANERNRGGLGLGLHIGQAIARSHGGWLQYSHAEPYVVFTARIPMGGPANQAAPLK
jgi:chemotaxis family two-component system sensor kinase Cph1